MLVSAALALTRRNLVYSALLLIVTWASMGVFYLWAGAEFLGFAQILVYAGAVSMVVLFAVLLTRPEAELEPIGADSLRRALLACATAVAVAAVLITAVLHTPFAAPAGAAPTVTVLDLGQQLMGPHAPALLILGLLLTVALLGAVTIAAASRTERHGRSIAPGTEVPPPPEVAP